MDVSAGVAVEQFPDVRPTEIAHEELAAPGEGHRGVAVRCALQQRSADIGFEALDLQVQVLRVQAECFGAVDAGVGHDLLKPLQALPSVALAFDRAANVVW